MTTCYNRAKRIFFVHIPKCAGTTIGGEYNTITGRWKNCWLNDQIGGFTRDGLPNGHQPVRTIEHWTGKPLDWWDKIIVSIRNPFRQQRSQYKFWRNRGQNCLDNRAPLHQDDEFALSVSFKQFVLDPRSNGPNSTCGDRWKECGGVYRWWIADESNNIPPNVELVKVESLSADLSRIFGLSGNIKLPVTNSTNPESARCLSHYDDEMLAHMRRKFAWSLTTQYTDALPGQ